MKIGRNQVFTMLSNWLAAELRKQTMPLFGTVTSSGFQPKTSRRTTRILSLKLKKQISEEGLENSSARLLPENSMVISARGTVGKYSLLGEAMTFSQSNYGIKPRFEGCYFFTYLLVAHCVEYLAAAAYETVFDTITRTTFKEHKIQLPPETEIRGFEKLVSPYFQKIKTNQRQIRTLTALRDGLLPKLMSRYKSFAALPLSVVNARE